MKVQGFQFSGIACGIKGGNLPDLALIRSNPPAVAVGLFTANRLRAAPVIVSEKHLRQSPLCSAVIINSGNANACTGRAGLRAAERMAILAAAALKVPRRRVLVCSTGKIGVPLPLEPLKKGIPRLIRGLKEGGARRAARAILTTDDSVKIVGETGKIGGRPFRLLAFTKGAGMIAPHLIAGGRYANVPPAPPTKASRTGKARSSRQANSANSHATMLTFFMTDLKIGRKTAATLFRRCAEQTFNRITVDGDTSTNDTALLLANGLAGNSPVTQGSRAARLFEKILFRAMERIALMMVEDGEGATRCVKIEVKGAVHETAAKKIAFTIANSPLVKTSFYGGDPNWGRLLAAAGRSGATRNPAGADIYYDKVCVARRGLSAGSRADRLAKKVMKKRRFDVTIDLKEGRGRFWVWTSDLTLDYVKLNAIYRT